MFALITYDEERRVLQFARDPIGIKPLYFASSNSAFYIASELKALAPQADLTEIHETIPGCYYEVHLGKLKGGYLPQAIRYWNFPTACDEPVDTNNLCNSMQVAVTECLATNSNVAVHLSGGVDSAGILALALRSRKDVSIVTIGQEGAPDTEAARDLSEELGFEVHVGSIPGEDELFERVPEIVFIAESFEPNVIRQSSAHLYLARAAHNIGARVVLCGEGADELFGGYPEFLSSSNEEFVGMRRNFLEDLHRTQLQRVDRISMSYTLETRVPFLRREVVKQALESQYLPSYINRKLGLAGTKVCLREALLGHLPDRWRCRPKMVLSEGMGLGGNDPIRGMFTRIAEKMIDSHEMTELQNEYPEWNIRSAEEAVYFREFCRMGFNKLKSAQRRVFANAINSRGSNV